MDAYTWFYKGIRITSSEYDLFARGKRYIPEARYGGELIWRTGLRKIDFYTWARNHNFPNVFWSPNAYNSYIQTLPISEYQYNTDAGIIYRQLTCDDEVYLLSTKNNGGSGGDAVGKMIWTPIRLQTSTGTEIFGGQTQTGGQSVDYSITANGDTVNFTMSPSGGGRYSSMTMGFANLYFSFRVPVTGKYFNQSYIEHLPLCDVTIRGSGEYGTEPNVRTKHYSISRHYKYWTEALSTTRVSVGGTSYATHMYAIPAQYSNSPSVEPAVSSMDVIRYCTDFTFRGGVSATYSHGFISVNSSTGEVSEPDSIGAARGWLSATGTIYLPKLRIVPTTTIDAGYRVGMYEGNIGYFSNGVLAPYHEKYLLNEGQMTVENLDPASSTQASATSINLVAFRYDYATRTYSEINVATGDSYSIAFLDDHIQIMRNGMSMAMYYLA